MVILTFALASVTPSMRGLLLLVMPSVALTPVSSRPYNAADLMAGGVVSGGVFEPPPPAAPSSSKGAATRGLMPDAAATTPKPAGENSSHAMGSLASAIPMGATPSVNCVMLRAQSPDSGM